MTSRESETVIHKQPHLSSCVVHYFLSRQVTLVAHQKFIDIFTGISVNFLKPLLDIVIGLLCNENEYEQKAVSIHEYKVSSKIRANLPPNLEENIVNTSSDKSSKYWQIFIYLLQIK